MRGATRHASGGSDGFIVVAVLWILGMLATLAAIYALYVGEVAHVLGDYDDRLRAEELARGGVELAVYRLTADPEARPVSGSFRFRQGDASVAVVHRAEAGRIDINFAPSSLISGLLASIGVEQEEAASIAEHIVTWRSALKGTAAEREAALYRLKGWHYRPRFGPFQHVNEVSLVLGMRPAILEQMLPHLTVYSGRAEVNVLVATPAVLAALPGMTARQIDHLVGARSGASRDFVQAQAGMAAQYVTLQSGSTHRVSVEVDLDNGPKVRCEAVVLLLEQDSEPYRMLSWQSNVQKE